MTEIEKTKGKIQQFSQHTTEYEQRIDEATTVATPLALPNKITIYVVDDEPQQ